MRVARRIAPIQSSSHLDVIKKFIAFTKTTPAQDRLAQAGYRPVLKSVAKKYRSKFPARALIRIDNPMFGGWRRVDKRWFDTKSGLMVGIEKAVGGPTG